MDPDFYIEESNPKKIVLGIILIILLLGGAFYYFYQKYQSNIIKLKAVTVELGTKLSSNINDYATGAINGYILDTSNVHLNSDGITDSTGEYSYKIINNSKIKTGKIIVKDTIAPKVTTKDLTVGVNEKFDTNEFLTECDDLSLPCTVTYDNSSDATLNSKAGEYTTNIIISDKEGNKVKQSVKLIVSDTTTLLSQKQNDFNISYISPKDADWNNTFTYKFSKCVEDDSEDYQSVISDLSSKDYQSTNEKPIKKQSIIAIYNKYDYIIGFSVKLTFDDDTIIFVTT
jgi:hypothetical protein